MTVVLFPPSTHSELSETSTIASSESAASSPISPPHSVFNFLTKARTIYAASRSHRRVLQSIVDRLFDGLTQNERTEPSNEMKTATMKARAGVATISSWKAARPVPGWNARTPFVNPRAPAVPATLDINLEEYYTAAALIGILCAQGNEPDMDWAADWSEKMGAKMAARSRKRRRRSK